ncbi:cytochrome b [Legionella spiritensis]|uniref:Cytochrome b561 transmembrane protein n=1 Tax=Legionella spiritensis TaxID=452 RepID=A0A0W0YYB5_LEGSP|nr:cytochrome b [Legionella spiritensis]KTD61868.1 cytochrome b561 transmembrane protein [Legionella spiritensis]SNV31358.1 cytochrome b561 transmembrane protein [Legionella spiritensis]VEG92102.1 cytochrome b561 transmembrane protein [Legionella spiritensis]
MQIQNNEDHYGVISIFLHWLMAVLMIAVVILGLVMTRIPMRFTLYEWHKDIGISILIWVCIRFIWRLINISPSLATLPFWEQLVSKCVVYFCYAFMFIIPMTGWLLLSVSDLPVTFLGFNLPELLEPNDTLESLFLSIHKWLSYILIFLMIIHIAAALKHFFIDKDKVLQRITRL